MVKREKTIIINRKYPIDGEGVRVFIDVYDDEEEMKRLLKALEERGIKAEGRQIFCG